MLEDLTQTAGPGFPPDDPPVRLVVRLSSDYILRLAELISAHIGDVVTGVVLMDLFHANTEHFPDTEGGSADAGWTAETFLPDEHRRPVRPLAISERLAIAPDTVRRHLLRLDEADLCERNANGFVVTGALLPPRGPGAAACDQASSFASAKSVARFGTTNLKMNSSAITHTPSTTSG